MNDIVRIFDTSLRDGEQSPGCSMSPMQKLRFARALDELQVDVIEAGFPAASDGDFASVEEVAAAVKYASVAALARCNASDIAAAGRALARARKPRIHVFIATSAIHMEHKLRMDKEQVLAAAIKGVRQAREYVDDVEFSAEDASRSDPVFLAEVFSAVIEAGATTLNVPDTVGYTTPEEYEALFRYLREHVRGIEGAVLSAHCHDDLGLAVANSLAAIRGGARQVECTINGIGERAGNAALEEIVMALRTRESHYGVKTGIVTEKLAPTSKLLVSMTGSEVQRHKAIVGENAFAHESGIHQHGMLRNRETYEIMNPEDVGVLRSNLVLGKHSGRAALRDRLAELGFTPEDDELGTIFTHFKTLADKKKEVFDSDLEALAMGGKQREAGPWRLRRLNVVSGCGAEAVPTGSVKLEHEDGRILQEASSGDGPVHAIFSAIERATGTQLTLTHFSIRSLSTGEDAQGVALIEAIVDGQEHRGRAVSTDILEASANALLEIINRHARQRGRGPRVKPERLSVEGALS